MIRLHRLTPCQPLKFASISRRYKSHKLEETQDLPGSFVPLQNTKDFTQAKPKLNNPYIRDVLLQSYLKRCLPTQQLEEVDSDLRKLGKRVVEELDEKSRSCEVNPPTLTHYDAWGNRIDQVETCHEWKYMKKVSAQEGLIATGYERNYQEWSRLVQMAKLYVFAPSSGLYSCPLAMADGAAKLIENVSTDGAFPFLNTAFQNLTSRDPEKFWTSGQWMTEKEGGSDVANGTATVAHLQEDDTYKLTGYKWFTSATDSDMTFTLARIVDENGNIPPGSKGLSLFYVETRDPLNRDEYSGLNGMRVERLKSKLGTRQLPTGELSLDGTRAFLVGKPSQGVKLISTMLTITRIHNSITATSNMRRIMQLVTDYSTKRTVFGSKLNQLPLHVHTLARMEVETRAASLFAFDICRLLGITEVNCPLDNSSPQDDDDFEDERNLLRLLTPVCKLYTAKQAVSVVSEGIESFGGAGYLEDTDIPRILRDTQVLSIWEGTTNVLSLDTLRSIAKSRGRVLNSFYRQVNGRLTEVGNMNRIKEIKQAITKVHIATGDLRAFIGQANSMGSDTMFTAAREFSYTIARIYCAVLLLEQATCPHANVADIHAAVTWCTSQDLCPAATSLRASSFIEAALARNQQLLFDNFHQS